MLTHPAWLIAFSKNTETDPIHRGIWIQEQLLAGTIPDVPITVDAVIPDNPHKTLRQRLDDKTNNDYCMRCHVKINPLGLPFAAYFRLIHLPQGTTKSQGAQPCKPVETS